MVGSTKTRLILFALLLTSLVAAEPAAAQSHALHEMSLERWGKMREVERHQMKVAEKYFRERNWSVAADEYDKYLTLYERSDAAPHALLKWSLCQVELRHQNTAINDGFRSVIDYWPDSEDAVAAAYYVGKTLRDIGQNTKAKSALQEVVDDHAKHLAGLHAMVALAEIAAIEKDDKAKVEIWRRLTFDATRNKRTARQCENAANQLAAHLFASGGFDEATKSLATNYQNDRLHREVVQRSGPILARLVGSSDTEAEGIQLADRLVDYLRQQEPEDISAETGKQTAKQLCYLIVGVQRTARRDQQVESMFSEIAKRFGSDDELLGQMADWYKSNDEYEKARSAYQRFADKVAGLSQIATSYRQQRRLSPAIETYAQLVAADAENKFRWQGESAWTYREFGKYDEAIAIYSELMKQDINNADRWLWETATANRDASKWKQAIGFFRQSNRFPDNYREMASCHRRLKQHSEAVILYQQIAGGHNASAPWAMLQIGYTEEEANQKEKAIAAFKKVCKLFPKDHHASRAHAHLQTKYKISVTLGGAKD